MTYNGPLSAAALDFPFAPFVVFRFFEGVSPIPSSSSLSAGIGSSISSAEEYKRYQRHSSFDKQSFHAKVGHHTSWDEVLVIFVGVKKVVFRVVAHVCGVPGCAANKTQSLRASPDQTVGKRIYPQQ